MVSIKSPSRPNWLGDGLVVQSELGAGGGGAGGGNPPFADTIGDGVATSFVVNHNLGSRDVVVSVYENSAPYTQVFPRIEHTDINNVTVEFATAPATSSRRVVVAYATSPTEALEGTLAARPAATAVEPGTLYFVTNEEGGKLSKSNGSVWSWIAPGLDEVSGKRIAYASITANFGPVTTETDVTGLNISFVAPTKPVRLEAWAGAMWNNTAGGGSQWLIYDSDTSALITFGRGDSNTANQVTPPILVRRHLDTLTPGNTYNYKVRINRVASTGQASLQANATQHAYIGAWVE